MYKVNEHIGLVYKVFNSRFADYRWLEEDLIQEGCIGLWKACNSYDKERGVAFSTFATICITNCMRMYLRKQRRHHENVDSLNKVIAKDESGSLISLLDTVKDASIQSLEEKLEFDAIMDIIKQTDCADIVTMKLAGLTQKEIAGRLKISQSRVSEKLRELYPSVRKKMEDK